MGDDEGGAGEEGEGMEGKEGLGMEGRKRGDGEGGGGDKLPFCSLLPIERENAAENFASAEHASPQFTFAYSYTYRCNMYKYRKKDGEINKKRVSRFLSLRCGRNEEQKGDWRFAAQKSAISYCALLFA